MILVFIIYITEILPRNRFFFLLDCNCLCLQYMDYINTDVCIDYVMFHPRSGAVDRIGICCNLIGEGTW